MLRPPCAPFLILVKVALWDGSRAGDTTGMRVRILDRDALRQVVRNPALHFGDLYAAGRIEVDGDLVTFLERTYAALDAGSTRPGTARLTAACIPTGPPT